MNLRDQLLKSGLASKEQAKKAQREVSKKQHQKIQEAKDSSTPQEPSVGEQTLAAKREADRLLNLKRNEERLQKEADARVLDIIASHDLTDARGSEAYYFVVEGKRIAKIMVNEEQVTLLEQGQLAVVSRDAELGFNLIAAANADKIRVHHPHFIICQHNT